MNKLITLLKNLVVISNVVFIIWIVYNGMEEGVHPTLVQMTAYVGIIILLALNAYLLSRKKLQ